MSDSSRLLGAAQAYDAFLERVRREYTEHQDMELAAERIAGRLSELSKSHEVLPSEILAAQALLVRVLA